MSIVVVLGQSLGIGGTHPTEVLNQTAPRSQLQRRALAARAFTDLTSRDGAIMLFPVKDRRLRKTFTFSPADIVIKAIGEERLRHEDPLMVVYINKVNPVWRKARPGGTIEIRDLTPKQREELLTAVTDAQDEIVEMTREGKEIARRSTHNIIVEEVGGRGIVSLRPHRKVRR